LHASSSQASIQSRTSDTPSEEESRLPKGPRRPGPGPAKENASENFKKMSAAEQELQMTEEALDPEKHISWSQV